MPILVRPITPDDALAALEVHHAAVRVTAAKDYAPEIIEQWAPITVSADAISRFHKNPENEIRFVAEINGEVVGFAAIILASKELRACCVSPRAVGRGVGRALIAELEHTAKQEGLTILQLDSSLTAHPFYEAMGYQTESRGEHVLGSGQRMFCVHMTKKLAQ
ncbi:GNAT family N-acetyltransferase [Rhizobium rhizogenes]|uniref:GNAT family N-acetyltransferase n=1 Tax=Rhizobium rhizogenes TaxID=359 RepID=UPI0024BE5BE3|nr:GNAT family N-acetyltransferase [Rhizobium rhizogenes]MDJ1634747.1 GNAT family N-acetyltransferase [Rhizobium rhizogenes]